MDWLAYWLDVVSWSLIARKDRKNGHWWWSQKVNQNSKAGFCVLLSPKNWKDHTRRAEQRRVPKWRRGNPTTARCYKEFRAPDLVLNYSDRNVSHTTVISYRMHTNNPGGLHQRMTGRRVRREENNRNIILTELKVRNIM